MPIEVTGKKVVFSMIAGLGGFVAGGVSLSLQLAPFFVPPKIVSLQPDQVLLRFHQNPGGSKHFVRFAAAQRYVNNRRVGKPALLVRETATLTIAGKSYQYYWQSFEDFQPQGEKLESTKSSSHHPAVIGPGEVESHETYYAAPADVPRLEWKDFLVQAQKAPEVKVRFMARFYDGRSTSTICTVKLDKERLARLESRMWDAPTCQESEVYQQSPS